MQPNSWLPPLPEPPEGWSWEWHGCDVALHTPEGKIAGKVVVNKITGFWGIPHEWIWWSPSLPYGEPPHRYSDLVTAMTDCLEHALKEVQGD